MPPRKKKTAPASVGLDAKDLVGEPPRDVAALADQVREDGGAVIGSYRDPVGGQWLLLAALPIDQVEPTPFQRERFADRTQATRRRDRKVGRSSIR